MKDGPHHIDLYPQKKVTHNPVRKALIVDDEADIRYLLSNILRQANIQPVFAATLTEAEKLLESPANFYYVFLDNYLPDGLGIDRVKKWKDRYPSIHLIMITAHDSYQERHKAIGDGVDDFISKPFSKNAILNTIV